MKKILLNVIGAFLVSTHLLFAQFAEPIGKLLPTPDLSSEGHQYGASVAIEGDFAVVGAPGENAAYILLYNGSEWVQQSKLTSDSNVMDQFGHSVAIKGDIITVGAPYHVGDGAVYVFENQQSHWTTPTQVAKLTYDYEPNSFRDVNFGYSVQIATDLIVVGSNREAVFVFEKPEEGWSDASQTAVLTQSSPDFLTSFGRNISVSNNTIVTSDDRANSDQGLVYIYDKPATGWQDATETTTLSVFAQGGYRFGSSVSIENDVLVVGATRHGDNGVAYVFEKPTTGWQNATYSAKLTAANEQFETLGESVQISGKTIAVSSEKGGAIFLYERPASGWVSASEPTAKLEATNGKRYNNFGIPLSTDGRSVIAGAPSFGKGGTVFLYKKPDTGWVSAEEDQSLAAPFSSTATGDRFGSSVAIDQNYAVVASPDDDEVGRGAAYVFHFQNEQWNKVAKLTPSVPKEGTTFASTVGISGSTVVVATQGYDNKKIVAYVYEMPASGWQDMTESAQLTTLETDTPSKFDSKVSIDTSTIAVSVNMYNHPEAVYVFEEPTTGWADATPKATLTASEGIDINFGSAVAVSGNTIAVGASEYGQNRQGSVYVFEKPTTGWADMTETAQLSIFDSNPYDYFGSSVGISNNTIVAGATGKTFDDKAAFVFEKPTTGWIDTTETARLTTERVGGIGIGRFVDILDNIIVLDASGAAIIYQKPANGWTDMHQTLKVDAENNGINAVAISGDYLIAGTPYADFEGKDSGAAYVYQLLTNTPPQASLPIADVTAFADSIFTLTLDPATFTDADEDKLFYTATLLDGTSLPTWLSFDGNSLTFSGTPSDSDVDTINIKIVARDDNGEATADFVLIVQQADTQEQEGDKEEESDPETEKPSTEEEPVLEVDDEETVTGINDDIKREIHLYPNPSVGQLTITSFETIEQIQLSNAQGQVVLNQQFANGNTEVKLQALSPGLYWINVRTSQSTFTQRIIVQ